MSTLGLDETEIEEPVKQEKKEYTVEELQAILNDPKLPRAMNIYTIVYLVAIVICIVGGIVIIRYFGYIAGGVYAAALYGITRLLEWRDKGNKNTTSFPF